MGRSVAATAEMAERARAPARAASPAERPATRGEGVFRLFADRPGLLETTMAKQIAGAVGAGGHNAPSDVATVQYLLN